MNSYGSGLGIALLAGLLIMMGVLVLTALLFWLSWKWSRPGASFFKLAFPSILPFLAIVIRIVQPLSVQSFPAMIWVGGWGAIALGILGRAIWLRPGEDPGPLSVRRRKWDIIFTTVVASMLYTGWGTLTVWNVETGIEQPLLSPKEGISVFRFTPDDQQLVALQYGLSDWHAYIWNLVTGELAISHHLPIAAITGLALDDRGGEFAANVLPSSNNERHFLKPTIQRFDTATGAEHRGFSMPP